ncbi:MAG: MATE family efflux transporter [Proteobacteria bacterium]|nr:MAG: MATE family efflux transporter [Pseudomonadota bacterium]
MGMSITDVIMAGNVSAEDLASVGIGSGIWIPVLLFITGIILITSTLIARHHGAKEHDRIRFTGQQAIWMGLIAGVMASLFCLKANWIVDLLSITPEIHEGAIQYMYGLAWGGPAAGLYLALRNYCEGLSQTRPVMIIMLVGLLANIPLNYIFIHGKFGLPAMGGAGCGLSSSLVTWLMALLLVLHVKTDQRYDNYAIFRQFQRPRLRFQLGILAMGLPVGTAIFFEISLFSAMSLLVSKYGAVTLSSHEIARSVSGAVFMVPLSIGMAITVRSGYLLGNRNPRLAHISSMAGITMASVLAITSFTLTIVFRENLASIYSDQIEVIRLAAYIMLFTAVFQFSDAIQVCSAGALRACKDTKIPMVITFISYWVIGLPVGYLFAETNLIREPLGAPGYWLGATAGLTVAAILLLARYLSISRRNIAKARAETEAETGTGSNTENCKPDPPEEKNQA